jgi:hypothetical protein
MTNPWPYPYQRGNYYDILPIPAIAEHCIGVDAGPLRLVVESRELTNEILNTQLPPGSVHIEEGVSFDDFGASLHVCDAAGLEYLRFDCFENEPHYHYINNAAGGNLICRIDEVAEGDPIEWTLGRLRDRLPEMLDSCGNGDLAEAARADRPAILAAVDQVGALLEQARTFATTKRQVS